MLSGRKDVQKVLFLYMILPINRSSVSDQKKKEDVQKVVAKMNLNHPSTLERGREKLK